MGVHDSNLWPDRFMVLPTDSLQIFTLRDKCTQQQYLGRQLTSATQDLLVNSQAAIQNLIASKQSSYSPYVVNLQQCFRRKQSTNCTSYTVYGLRFNPPQHSLRQESVMRKFQNRTFTAEQILLVLESGVKGIYYLKGMNHPHRNINTRSFYITPQRHIVLSDPWMHSGEELNLSHHYPSPEQLHYEQKYIHSYDPYISALFSLGITLLELHEMELMDSIYQRKFNEVFAEVYMGKVERIHNEELRRKVGVLLATNTQVRSKIFLEYHRKGAVNRFVEKEKKIFMEVERNRQMAQLVKKIANKGKKQNNVTSRRGIDRVRQLRINNLVGITIYPKQNRNGKNQYRKQTKIQEEF